MFPTKRYEAVVKSGYDTARQAMEKLGMRPLLESNKQCKESNKQ